MWCCAAAAAVLCCAVFLRAGGVLFKTRTQYQGVLGKTNKLYLLSGGRGAGTPNDMISEFLPLLILQEIPLLSVPSHFARRVVSECSPEALR